MTESTEMQPVTHAGNPSIAPRHPHAENVRKLLELAIALEYAERAELAEALFDSIPEDPRETARREAIAAAIKRSDEARLQGDEEGEQRAWDEVVRLCHARHEE